MIRPETIRIVAVGASALSGVVDSVSFIGDRQRCIISGASHKPLTVDAPNTIEARAGERVGLAVPPDAIRLLPPET
jgi:putative spermidine/putrescine transport system ATP-binding protein